MFLRKKNYGIHCDLPHKLVGCNSIKNGVERYAGMLLRKNRNLFGCRNKINLSGFPPRKCIFFYSNFNHFIVRAPFMSYNQMHPLELMTSRIPIYGRLRIFLEYFKHFI